MQVLRTLRTAPRRGKPFMANMAAIMHGGSILSGVALIGQVGAVAGLPYLGFVGGVGAAAKPGSHPFSHSGRHAAIEAMVINPAISQINKSPAIALAIRKPPG